MLCRYKIQMFNIEYNSRCLIFDVHQLRVEYGWKQEKNENSPCVRLSHWDRQLWEHIDVLALYLASSNKLCP